MALSSNLTPKQIFRLASLENAIKIPHVAPDRKQLVEDMLGTAERLYQYLLEADKKRDPNAS